MSQAVVSDTAAHRSAVWDGLRLNLPRRGLLDAPHEAASGPHEGIPLFHECTRSISRREQGIGVVGDHARGIDEDAVLFFFTEARRSTLPGPQGAF
jgi:hypothetical protein